MRHKQTVEQRRAAVARMSQNGDSLREIAVALSVGKDTVRRDLEALKETPPTPPSETPMRQVRRSDQHNATDPTPGETPDATPPTSDETPHATADETPETPPGTVANPTVGGVQLVLDGPPAQLLWDLALLTSTGATVLEALTTAAHVWADMHRQAWSTGLYPHGSPPVLEQFQLAPHTPNQTAEPGEE